MGQIQLLDEVHAERLQQARHLFFDQGDLPEGLVDPLIVRSWERCRRFGIGETSMTPTTKKKRKERNKEKKKGWKN